MSHIRKESTIGQAFAARWLVRKYSEYKSNPKMRQRQPGLPESEDLAWQIAEAVDAYAERKIEELRRKMRVVAIQVADGKEGIGEHVELSAEEMLQHPDLLHVARQSLNASLSAIYKFPVQ